MPTYLFSGSYTQEGAKGLVKEGGSSRRATIETLAKSMGGSIETFYYTFGRNDVIAIANLPDDASATAISLAVGASGAANLRTTLLLTPETVDEAAKKTVNYRPPGG